MQRDIVGFSASFEAADKFFRLPEVLTQDADERESDRSVVREPQPMLHDVIYSLLILAIAGPVLVVSFANTRK